MICTDAGQAQALPARLRTSLAATLESGEEIVWFGQPDPRLRRRAGYTSVPFGLAFIALFVHAAPWIRGGWWWLTVVPAVLSLALVAAPVLLQAFARATLYAVTSRRVLIFGTAKHDKIRTYPIKQLPQLLMRPRPDGSGDLIFEAVHYQDADGYDQTREHGFEDIADVGMVRQIVSSLATGHGPGMVRRHAALWRMA